jgi:hypothetical protein
MTDRISCRMPKKALDTNQEPAYAPLAQIVSHFAVTPLPHWV